jgi:hypothetical protein
MFRKRRSRFSGIIMRPSKLPPRASRLLRIAGSITAVLAALGGCTLTQPKVEENALPTEYKPRILEYLHGRLPDPTGVRDAFISEPALRPVDARTSRYVICVKFNAKEPGGQYAGSKEMAAVYYAGQLTHAIAGNRELCGGAAYQPFPELTKLCREIRCPT